MNTTFKETQRFNQWWIWLLFAPMVIFMVEGIYQQLILGKPFGSKPMPDIAWIFYTLFVFALIALFLIMRLHTEMDSTGIRLRFVPFVKKQVRWSEVKRAQILDYGFVGGWGIRLWTRYGTVYNVRGRKGLAIELKDGTKFLIGTQREEEMKEVLARVRP